MRYAKRNYYYYVNYYYFVLSWQLPLWDDKSAPLSAQCAGLAVTCWLVIYINWHREERPGHQRSETGHLPSTVVNLVVNIDFHNITMCIGDRTHPIHSGKPGGQHWVSHCVLKTGQFPSTVVNRVVYIDQVCSVSWCISEIRTWTPWLSYCVITPLTNVKGLDQNCHSLLILTFS